MRVAMLLVAMAGCAVQVAPPGLDLAGAEAWHDGAAMLWSGSTLTGPPMRDDQAFAAFFGFNEDVPCGEQNCDRMTLAVPAATELSITIEWEAQDEEYATASGYMGAPALYMDLRIEQGGVLVADGVESGHYASVARLNAEPGTYEVVVKAVWGTGTYLGAVVPAAAPSQGLLLPDLVLLPSQHLQVTAPLAQPAAPLLDVVAPGCGPDEFVEDLDRRCLRFSGIVGNQGAGPFELVLEYEQASASVAGDGHWDQRLYHADGRIETRRAGQASYHAVHGHFHVAALVETQLHEVDAQTLARGEPIGEGRKTGFCLIDGGIIDLREPATMPQYFGAGCCYIAVFCQVDMATHERFHMGIGPGWYDIYPWFRADQYVEITGVEDGIYELVSTVNPDQTLTESQPGNNEASVLFRLTGDAVAVLGERTDARPGPRP